MRGLCQSLEPKQIPQVHFQNPRGSKLGSKHNLTRLPRGHCQWQYVLDRSYGAQAPITLYLSESA